MDTGLGLLLPDEPLTVDFLLCPVLNSQLPFKSPVLLGMVESDAFEIGRRILHDRHRVPLNHVNPICLSTGSHSFFQCTLCINQGFRKWEHI